MVDSNIRAALERHWAASDANDFNAEHQIYRQDAVLEYPQSGDYANWSGLLIAKALGDVHVLYLWRFLRAQKIDLSGRTPNHRCPPLEHSLRRGAPSPAV